MYLTKEPNGCFVRFLSGEEIAAVSRVCQKRAPSGAQRLMVDQLFREMCAAGLVLNCLCRATSPPKFAVLNRMGILRLAAHAHSRTHLPSCPVIHRQAGGKRTDRGYAEGSTESS